MSSRYALTRFARGARDLGGARTAAGWALLLIPALALAAAGSVFEMYIAGICIIYAISALGLDWIQGRAGQVSIGSAALMAIGAYVTAIAAGTGLPVGASLVLATVVGALAGLLIGLPALRLSGLYLALATLALQFLTAEGADQFQYRTDHASGFFLSPVTLGPVSLQYGQTDLVILVAILGIVIVALRNLYNRAPGRSWLAIKESQASAAVIGLDPVRWKLSAFVGSSALISFSGALLAVYTGHVSFETFSLDFAISFVAMVIIGGQGSIAGVILGAMLITTAPYLLAALTSQLPPSLVVTQWLSNNVYYINNGLYGLLVLGFLLYQPRGIAGMLQAAGRLAMRRSGARGASTPASTTPAPVASPGPEPARPVLAVRGLRIVYRTGACAVDGVDLDVNRAEIVALLGRNGAGKTSTLRGIAGFFASENVRVSGAITFQDRSILGASPISTSRRGLILVPERDKVFPSLTVREHLRMAGAYRSGASDELAELFPALKLRATSVAGHLSGGERQMLALAMAFCMRPRVLLIDELSLGLAPAIIKRLMESVRQFRDRSGAGILLVEQNVAAAAEVADRLYVLEAGRVVSAGTRDDVSLEILGGAPVSIS